MVILDTRMLVTRLMVDNDESGNQSVLPILCGPRSTFTIMTLKSATVHHPFLPASYNGRIASTPMTSDSPIFPTCLFNSMIRPLSNSDRCL
ncbi:hypothetical protein TNCV_1563771 [Trichonephila clavipes]|nr:hypothetical protein TNCV_1563771 [Trichonephila clavipes]